MTELGGFPDPIAGARDLTELLATACDAFAAALTVIRQHDQPDDDYFVPLVMAAAAAASARDYLLFAPSLAARQSKGVAGSGHSGPPDARSTRWVHASGAADSGSGRSLGDSEPGRPDSTLTARWLAWLCQLLGSRLTAAAVTARIAGDRRACRGAARCAREIAALMGGDSP